MRPRQGSEWLLPDLDLSCKAWRASRQHSGCALSARPVFMSCEVLLSVPAFVDDDSVVRLFSLYDTFWDACVIPLAFADTHPPPPSLHGRLAWFPVSVLLLWLVGAARRSCSHGISSRRGGTGRVFSEHGGEEAREEGEPRSSSSVPINFIVFRERLQSISNPT